MVSNRQFYAIKGSRASEDTIMNIRVGLCHRADNCAFVPSAAVGYCLTRRDFFGSLSGINLPMKTIDHTPQQKLQDLLVSILAGCQCLSQIDTKLRPEQALARAWQRKQFASQSTIADTLNAFTAETVDQLRVALTQIYRRHGHALQHDFTTGWLWLDIDLTGLLASRQAEGSEKGYFAGKKTDEAAKFVASRRATTTRMCSP